MKHRLSPQSVHVPVFGYFAVVGGFLLSMLFIANVLLPATFVEGIRALIYAAFVYEPGWIWVSLRFMTHSIESLADQVPEPWGARLEIMLRELGGMIWIQIASAIVLLRLIIWVPFHIWRLRRERRISYRMD